MSNADDDIQGLPAHLRDDAPHWQCSGCGRKSWAAREVGRVCAMPQPNGQTCTGRFLAPQPAPLFDTSAPPKLHAGFALCAAVEDLKKARWYLDREIQKREAAKS